MLRSRSAVIVAIVILWIFIFYIPYIFHKFDLVRSNDGQHRPRSQNVKEQKDASAKGGEIKNEEKQQENDKSMQERSEEKRTELSNEKQPNADQVEKKNDEESQKLDQEISNGKPKFDGAIEQGKNCVDTLEHQNGGSIGVFQCHGLGRNQYWYLTMKNQLKNNNLCIEAKSDGDGSGSVTLQECNADNKHQHWEYEGNLLILSGTKLCLDSKDPNVLSAQSCSVLSNSQKWKLHQ